MATSPDAWPSAGPAATPRTAPPATSASPPFIPRVRNSPRLVVIVIPAHLRWVAVRGGIRGRPQSGSRTRPVAVGRQTCGGPQRPMGDPPGTGPRSPPRSTTDFGGTVTDHITLAQLDADGAIQEAAYAVDPAGEATRSDFFKKAAISGGALVAGGVVFGGLPALAMGAPSKAQDVAILNYALTLEYLETAFYKEARAKAGLKGETAKFARVAGGHEA